MTVKDDTALCARVWAMPSVSHVKQVIQSTVGNKTANTYKFGGKGVQYE